MILGVDLDNTIICYDGIFHARALELGAIPPDLPSDKNSVSRYLKDRGRNDLWTQMQGEIYGPELHRADPFPGFREFVAAAVKHGDEVFIVSHKTRAAAANPDTDLHASARQWLEANGFTDDESGATGVCEAFFCETREEKVARISALSCDVFVDDLPEVFGEPGFPETTEKILFDPMNRHETWEHGFRARSWHGIGKRLFPD